MLRAEFLNPSSFVVPNFMIGNEKNDPYRDQKLSMLGVGNTMSSPSFNFSLASNSSWLDYLNPITSAFNSVWNTGSSIFNYFNAKEQRDYERALQQQIFEREDNAVQRRVEDLKKAGLNPVLAANGGGSNSGAVVSSNAPTIGDSPFQHLSFFDGSQYAVTMLKQLQDMQLNKDKVDILKAQLGINQDNMSLKRDKFILQNMEYGTDTLFGIVKLLTKILK